MIIKMHKDNKMCRLDDDEIGKNFLLLTGMPGYKRWIGRGMVFRPEFCNIKYIHEHWPGAKWEEGTEQYIDAFISQMKEMDATISDKISEIVDGDTYVYKTVPYEHQRKAFLLSRDKREFALLMDMGTGKTKVIIDTAAWLYSKGEIDALFVLTLSGITEQWITDQPADHLPEYIPWIGAMWKGPKKQQDKIWENDKKLRIYSMNIEAASTKKGAEFLSKFLSCFRTLLVIDESTTIKNHSSIRTKNLLKIAKQAKYRRILTGTPISEGRLEDSYSQLSFLNPDILGYSTYWSFRNQHCIMKSLNDRQKFIIGYKNVEHIQRCLEGFSYRVRKSECLDLPDKVYTKIKVDLSGEQKRAYNELKKELQTELFGETLTTELAITKLLRLQQITSNWWPGGTDEQGVKQFQLRQISASNPKLIALKTFLENSGEDKAIIWCRWRADVELLQKELGSSAVSYYGGVKKDDRDIAKKRFIEEPEIKYFIGNPSVAGYGLNLTVASLVVWYSIGYSLAEYLQANDRVHRIGQTRKVTYAHLIAKGTTDEKIVNALRHKKDIASSVLRDPVLLGDFLS